jgi:hypothetical protein
MWARQDRGVALQQVGPRHVAHLSADQRRAASLRKQDDVRDPIVGARPSPVTAQPLSTPSGAKQ